MNAQVTAAYNGHAASLSHRRGLVLARRLTCRTDEPLFHEGDAIDHRYEVVSGAVRACKLLPDGRRQILEFYLPGDVFGDDELDTCHGFSAEAAGSDETVLLQTRQRPMAAHTAVDPETMLRMRDQALRSLDMTRSRLLILGRLEAPERLAAFLLEMELRLVGRPPAREATPFVLPISRRDAADYLGITPETLSRCIQDLRRRAVIDVVRQRQVTILDRRTLVDMSCGAAAFSGGCPGHAERLPAVA